MRRHPPQKRHGEDTGKQEAAKQVVLFRVRLSLLLGLCLIAQLFNPRDDRIVVNLLIIIGNPRFVGRQADLYLYHTVRFRQYFFDSSRTGSTSHSCDLIDLLRGHSLNTPLLRPHVPL